MSVCQIASPTPLWAHSDFVWAHSDSVQFCSWGELSGSASRQTPALTSFKAAAFLPIALYGVSVFSFAEDIDCCPDVHSIGSLTNCWCHRVDDVLVVFDVAAASI